MKPSLCVNEFLNSDKYISPAFVCPNTRGKWSISNISSFPAYNGMLSLKYCRVGLKLFIFSSGTTWKVLSLLSCCLGQLRSFGAKYNQIHLEKPRNFTRIVLYFVHGPFSAILMIDWTDISINLVLENHRSSFFWKCKLSIRVALYSDSLRHRVDAPSLATSRDLFNSNFNKNPKISCFGSRF